MTSFTNETLRLVKNKESRDLLKNYFEVLIDTVTDSEIIKRIPFVDTLTSCGKIALSIRDRIFFRKLLAFLERLDDFSQEEIDNFIDNIREKNKIEELGEKIISTVDQADTKRKARLLGILFIMYLKGELSKNNFELLCFCVNKAFLIDLYLLYHTRNNEDGIDERLGNALMNCGLANIIIEQIGGKTKLGDKFITDNDSTVLMSNRYIVNEWGRMLFPAIKKLIKVQTGENY